MVDVASPRVDNSVNGVAPTVKRRRRKKPANGHSFQNDNEAIDEETERPTGLLRPSDESNAKDAHGRDNDLKEGASQAIPAAGGSSASSAKQGYWSKLKEQRRQEQLKAKDGIDLAPPLTIRAPPISNSTLGVVPSSADSSSSGSSTPVFSTPPMSASPILGRDEERRQLAEMAKTGLTPEQRAAARDQNRFVPPGETIPFMASAGRSRPRFFPNRTLVNANAASTPSPSETTRTYTVVVALAPESSAALQNAVHESSTPPTSSHVMTNARPILDQGQTGPAGASASLHVAENPRFPPGLGIGIELPPALRVNLGSSTRAADDSPLTIALAAEETNAEKGKGRATETSAPSTPRILLSPITGSTRDLSSASSSSSDMRSSASADGSQGTSRRKGKRRADSEASAGLADFATTVQQVNETVRSGTLAIRLPGAERSMAPMIVRSPVMTSRLEASTAPDHSSSTAVAFRSRSDGWRSELRSDVHALNNARRHLTPTPSFLPYIRGLEMRRWHSLHRDLRRAIINRNPPAAAAPCVVNGCSSVLPSPISWLDHIESAHAKCVQCDRVFLNRHALSEHIRTAENHFAEMAPHPPAAAEPIAPPTETLAVHVSLTDGWDEMDQDVASSVDADPDRTEDLVPYCDSCDLVFPDFVRLQDHLDFAEVHQEPADASAEPVVRSPRRTRTTTASAVAATQPAVGPAPASVAPPLPVSSKPSAASVLAGKKRVKTDEERCPWPIPCAICLEVCDDITTTLCGHVGCRRCLQMAVARSLSCPTCRRDAKLSDLHPLYLPGSYEFPPLKGK